MCWGSDGNVMCICLSFSSISFYTHTHSLLRSLLQNSKICANWCHHKSNQWQSDPYQPWSTSGISVSHCHMQWTLSQCNTTAEYNAACRKGPKLQRVGHTVSNQAHLFQHPDCFHHILHLCWHWWPAWCYWTSGKLQAGHVCHMCCSLWKPDCCQMNCQHVSASWHEASQSLPYSQACWNAVVCVHRVCMFSMQAYLSSKVHNSINFFSFQNITEKIATLYITFDKLQHALSCWWGCLIM